MKLEYKGRIKFKKRKKKPDNVEAFNAQTS